MQKVAASIVIHRIPSMTEVGRKKIVAWMRMLAKEIEHHPEAFQDVFRARYWYGKAEKKK